MTLRQEKINSLIQEELSRIINRELEFPSGCLMTITGIDASTNLKHAKIYISVLPEKFRGSALEILRKNTGRLQALLNRRLEIKFSPKIEWLIDTTEERAAGIEELLDKIQEEL